jgi:pimeloyl-ACP methyl ester carboxylesterase
VNAFYFGASARQLFGAYHPAKGRSRGGVVICAPLGREYLLAHATLRYLARLLADAGFDVLRFDYFGTGDSAGAFEEASQQQWLADIATAITELKDLAHVDRVSLVGMRYGATLAAIVARTQDGIDGLVLWDTVTSGRDYLQEFGVIGHGRDGPAEGHGVALTTGMIRDMENVTPDILGSGLPRTLLLAEESDAADLERHRLRLAGSGVECSLVSVPDVPTWRDERLGASGMPVATLHAIVSWFG